MRRKYSEKCTRSGRVSSAQHRPCTAVVGGLKAPCQAKCDGFEASALFPGLIAVQPFPVSVPVNCSERTIIRDCQRSHLKSEESTEEVLKNSFQECFKKLAKVCHCPWELL
jgi:hypothetical protein